MFEFFEHTADLGIRVRSPAINTLFAEAGTALFTVILRHPSAIKPLSHFEFQLEESDLDFLFRDWLAVLLSRFEEEKIVYTQFLVQIEKGILRASARGEPFDPARHGRHHEVKAVTYHGLKVEETQTGWLAEVIVDI